MIEKKELEKLIYKDLVKPELFEGNVFLEGSFNYGAYERHNVSGRIEEMRLELFEKMKAERLREITPRDEYIGLVDGYGDSLHGTKLFVLQKGRGNQYSEWSNFLENKGLSNYDFEARSDEESGSGRAWSQIRLSVWLKPNDKSMAIYATDLTEHSQVTSTGDIIGRVNSMNYKRSYASRRVKVASDLLDCDQHLALISTMPLARAIRKLF